MRLRGAHAGRATPTLDSRTLRSLTLNPPPSTLEFFASQNPLNHLPMHFLRLQNLAEGLHIFPKAFCASFLLLRIGPFLFFQVDEWWGWGVLTQGGIQPTLDPHPLRPVTFQPSSPQHYNSLLPKTRWITSLWFFFAFKTSLNNLAEHFLCLKNIAKSRRWVLTFEVISAW